MRQAYWSPEKVPSCPRFRLSFLRISDPAPLHALPRRWCPYRVVVPRAVLDALIARETATNYRTRMLVDCAEAGLIEIREVDVVPLPHSRFKNGQFN